MVELEEPNLNDKIWRYMSLPKFISILERKSLYFVIGEKLKEFDPYEGATTAKSEIYRKDIFENETMNRKRWILEMESNIPHYSYVSCWHLNEYESAALWSLYGKTDGAIAIQSTYGGLKDSLEEYWLKRMLIRKVNYIDYNHAKIPFGNQFYLLMHKRKDFLHEQELRAIMFHPDGKGIIRNDDAKLEPGIYVPVNVQTLVKTIYIAPTSSQWHLDLVRSLCEKYGVALDIEKSHLLDTPHL